MYIYYDYCNFVLHVYWLASVCLTQLPSKVVMQDGCFTTGGPGLPRLLILEEWFFPLPKWHPRYRHGEEHLGPWNPENLWLPGGHMVPWRVTRRRIDIWGTHCPYSGARKCASANLGPECMRPLTHARHRAVSGDVRHLALWVLSDGSSWLDTLLKDTVVTTPTVSCV